MNKDRGSGVPQGMGMQVRGAHLPAVMVDQPLDRPNRDMLLAPSWRYLGAVRNISGGSLSPSAQAGSCTRSKMLSEQRSELRIPPSASRAGLGRLTRHRAKLCRQVSRPRPSASSVSGPLLPERRTWPGLLPKQSVPPTLCAHSVSWQSISFPNRESTVESVLPLRIRSFVTDLAPEILEHAARPNPAARVRIRRIVQGGKRCQREARAARKSRSLSRTRRRRR